MRRKPQDRLATIVGVVLVAGCLTSCGSSITTPPKPGTGTLITIVHDVPLCNAISANVVVEGLNFTTQQGGATFPYLNTTPAFAPEIKLNLQQLRDFSTILYEYPVQAGSYYQANLSFELAQLVAYDPTLSPPTHVFAITLTNPKPIITLNPVITILANQANVIDLDFNVLAMLGTNSTENLTGQITPVVNITQLQSYGPSGATNPNGFGEIDDLWGFVRSVTTTNKTSNPTYTGSFEMQLLSPSTADAPEVPINISPSTVLSGFADLGHLLPDSYVEADVIIDPQGNVTANTVEMQEVENPFPTQVGVTPSTALIGPIVSIQTDPAGNPSQLNMWVRDAEPDDTSTLTMDTIYQVDLTNNPTYTASIMGPNFANLPFGPKNLAVGQELVVHGAYTRPPATSSTTSPALPYSVEPTAIYLRLQSMQGTLYSMVEVGSDDETGVFILSPCCTLLQGVPLYVVTNNQTAFVNVTGLGAITPVNTLLVKGMPYYEPHATTINGVAIPAGTLVMQAKQVHVLQ
ncbi:MAG: hypothetical protein ACLQVG_08600 [Terriglobia bacterium]